jgi:hypothetical protein
MRDAVFIEKSQGLIQPFPAPPLPPEALALSDAGQMAPNLLFYPVSDVPEAPARMSDREVVHPAAQNGIDLFDQLTDGPGTKASENRLELAKQGRPLFAFRRVQRHPSAPVTPDATELKTEKSKTPSFLKVHLPALFLRSPPPVVWPTPPEAASPPPREAMADGDANPPGSPDHRRTWHTRPPSTARRECPHNRARHDANRDNGCCGKA